MIKKLLDILFCKFRQSSSKPSSDIQIFMKNHIITFHGFGGLNIRGLVASVACIPANCVRGYATHPTCGRHKL